MPDKRFVLRYPKRIPVKFGFGYALETGEIENVSLSGMFLKTERIYVTGTKIKIEYTLPKNITVGIDGEVRWKREYSTQWIRSEKKNGLGIRIVRFYSGEQVYHEMIGKLQQASS